MLHAHERDTARNSRSYFCYYFSAHVPTRVVPMSRRTAKARTFTLFLMSGFNLEGNRGAETSTFLLHNVCGMHVHTRTGDTIGTVEPGDTVHTVREPGTLLFETKLDGKATRAVELIQGADARVAILVDTHMTADEMLIFQLHLERVYGLTCASTPADAASASSHRHHRSPHPGTHAATQPSQDSPWQAPPHPQR